MELKAQIPVSVGGLWQSLPREYVLETLEELRNLSGHIEMSLSDYGSVEPVFSVVASERKRDLGLGYGSTVIFNRPDFYEVLEVEASIDVGAPQIEQIIALNPDLPLDKATSLLLFGLSNVFETKLYDMILLTNVARPGAIDLFEGHVLIEGHTIRVTRRFHSSYLQDAVHLASKREWPQLGNLPVGDAWRWYGPIDGLSGGYSTGPTGRALNALSHLTALSSSQPLSLLWALMGLEALYVRASGGVTEQLREKLHAFLGSPETHKKSFSRMYDLRSRIVHGQLDFSSAYSDVEGPESDNFYREVGGATDLATALLLATLQELIKRGWRDLSFSYSVDDP
jgi:hypothetical protein